MRESFCKNADKRMFEILLKVWSYSTDNTVNLFTSNWGVQITGHSMKNPVLMIYICYPSYLHLPAHIIADFWYS